MSINQIFQMISQNQIQIKLKINKFFKRLNIQMCHL